LSGPLICAEMSYKTRQSSQLSMTPIWSELNGARTIFSWFGTAVAPMNFVGSGPTLPAPSITKNPYWLIGSVREARDGDFERTLCQRSSLSARAGDSEGRQPMRSSRRALYGSTANSTRSPTVHASAKAARKYIMAATARGPG